MKKFTLFSILVLSLSLVACSNNDREPNPNANPINESFTFKILSSNDIHGQVDSENESSNNGRLGLGKYLSYAKKIKDEEKNVLLFDSGDTFQGSIYSNENRGALLSEAMAYAHYDARAIGNHDFDWGIEPLQANKNRGYGDYVVPTLGANIYDYDFVNKRFLDTYRSDLGDKTTICTFTNGFKVGVIGTIGSSQITSINTLYVKDINFKNHINVIKEEATKLKEAGCHFIVSLHHGAVDELLNKGLDKYIDLALCGHTHKLEEENEKGTRYFQFGEYTKYLGSIEYSFDASTQKISYKSYKAIKSQEIVDLDINVDPTLQSLIDNHKAEVNSHVNANEVLANNVRGYFSEYEEGSNLMAKAVYDTAKNEGYDIDFAYVNQLRHSFYKNELTYMDIYEAAPFDNVIYIYDITYDEMLYEVKRYNNICKEDGRIIELDRNKTYKIATLDYLLFHTNTSRRFDYFSSMNDKFASRDTFLTLSKTYREVLKDWLIANDYPNNKELNVYNFTNSNSMFNKTEIR